MTAPFLSWRRYTGADIATQSYIAFIGIVVLFFHDGSVPHWPVLVSFHLAGLLAIHWLICSPRRGLRGILHDFYPILLLSLLWREIGWVNQVFVSTYQDAFFVQCDQFLFGVQPGIWMMDRFSSRWTGELFYGAYFSYYVMILGTGVALHRQNREQFLQYITVLCMVLFACFVIYVFLPVIGARVFSYDFGGYRVPDGICDVTWPYPYPASVAEGFMYGVMEVLYRHFEVDGAAFPSSHVAVSLCTLTFSWRYLKRIRWAHLVLFILLSISTVYCRYHYAVDVLGGLVYGGAWCWLGHWLYRRNRPPVPESEPG